MRVMKDSRRWESFIIAIMRALLYRMLRLHSAQALILLAVLGLIGVPPVLVGFHEARKAEQAWAERNYHSAAAHYEHAAWLIPWRTDLWEKAGRSAFLDLDFQKAVLLLKRAGHLSDVGWSTLAILYRFEGQSDLAVQTIQQGIAEVGASRILYTTLWQTYFMAGNLEGEQDALQKFLPYVGELRADDPIKSLAYYRMGLFLLASDSNRALDNLFQASSLNSDYSSAVQTLRASANLAALESDESRRLVVIGRGLGLVNEWTLAERVFRQAVGADEENAEAWAWLGEAKQHIGQEGGAALEQALSLDPANPVVHNLRALYWMRQGQPEQALDEYRLAAQHDPENPLWQASIGEVYARLGNLPPALQAYQRAVELAPNEANYWRLLAVFCAQYGVQVEQIGLPAARHAASLAPNDPQALDALGWTLALLEQPDEALYHLARALSLEPDLASAHLHYGMAALQKNDRSTAYQHLLQARDLDTDGPVSEQAQALLNQYFP